MGDSSAELIERIASAIGSARSDHNPEHYHREAEAVLAALGEHDRPSPTDYDFDPKAIEWARGKVQWAIDKADRFADQGGERADQWRRMSRIFHMWLLGSGKGCVITPLDPRLPEMKRLMQEARDA